jgi:hypothetical protein
MFCQTRTCADLLKRTLWAALVIPLAWSSWVEAAPIKVRLPEGNLRGFLVLRTMDGQAIAHGEMVQHPAGGLIESRLALNFPDGSLRDEHATYSQKDVFRLKAYRLVQRGPSFPTSEISFDRRSGRYQAQTQEKKGDEPKEASGALDMPDDLYNGMALVLLKNLSAGASTRIAVFTPKPRIITMKLTHEGDDMVRVGPTTKTARRYLVKLEIGGLTGVMAAVIGKKPPDLRYWLVSGDVPAFARFQGAMYLNGPVWRLELIPVEWPK